VRRCHNMSRRFFVGGNWKQNGTTASITQLLSELNAGIEALGNVADVLIAPPTVYLQYTKDRAHYKFLVSAQNASVHAKGAFTGQTSPAMLKDIGVNWTLLGHSERRSLCQEDPKLVAEKTFLAQQNNLNVVFCIGETLAEREANKTTEVLYSQLQPLLDKVNWSQVVIAYEPVWAIGTGKVATPEQAQEAHVSIREWLAKNVSKPVADSTRIIYGGSVTPASSGTLAAQKDIDGFLVGGASLKAADFLAIVKSAETKAKL